MKQPVMVGAPPTDDDLDAIDAEPDFSPLDDDPEAYLFLEHLPGVNFPFLYPGDRGLSFAYMVSDDDPDDDLPIIGGEVVA